MHMHVVCVYIDEHGCGVCVCVYFDALDVVCVYFDAHDVVCIYGGQRLGTGDFLILLS